MAAKKYNFANSAEYKRKRDIEAEGTPLYLSHDRVMIIRAATDANPAWATQSEKFWNEIRRLSNQKASNDVVRKYVGQKMASLLVKDWSNFKDEETGIVIPFSVDACVAMFEDMEDVYDLVWDMVTNSKNFRGDRIEGIVEEVKH